MGLFSKNRRARIFAGDKIAVIGARGVVKRRLSSSPRREPPQRAPIPKIVYKVFLALLFCAAAVYIIFISEIFSIKAITIEGAKTINISLISSKISKGQNIFLFNGNNLEKDLIANYPEIKEIVIYKGLPSTLKVALVEREPALAWESNSRKYLVDNEGVAYKLTADSGSSFVITDPLNIPVDIGSKVIDVDFVSFITDAQKCLTNEANIKITGIQIRETNFDVDIMTADGYHILLDTERSAAKQVSALIKILAEKRDLIHEYVDLRVSGLAFIK